MSFYYGSTIVLLIWEKRLIQVRALKEDLNFSSRQKQQHTQIVHGLFTRAFCHRPIKLSSTLVVVVFILQLNCNVSVNAPTVFRLSGILELLSCALSLQLCIALRFQFFRNFFILPLVFFKPVNTSRGPRPGCCRRCSVYLCGCCVQDSFVGPGMHSLAVKSTAWLWLIVLHWGFHPTRLPYYNKKGDKKTCPLLTSCSRLFIRKRAGNDVAWNLDESGIYFTWVLLSKSHTMTNTYDYKHTVEWDLLKCHSNDIRYLSWIHTCIRNHLSQ